ncbi:unnamed protein product [Leptidea sinapis]|uniref:Uncharacterized protein n=1 Tax=Leptidea sinapis TaxID=189913 RepID=A0A5E4PZD7_9NEOP|nr:unnamed protein product [Leptidea sinapis]
MSDSAVSLCTFVMNNGVASFSFIKLMTGTTLLLSEGYTFSRISMTSNLYYCSSRKKGCKSELSYSFIKLLSGATLLLYEGYTFSQNSWAKNLYYCSQKMKGCKARLKLDANGVIFPTDVDHKHPPPKYSKGCKGRIKLDINGDMLPFIGDHNHPPPCYMKTKYGYYSKGCKGRIKLDINGDMLHFVGDHNHPPPCYMKTQYGYYGFTFAKNSLSKHMYYCSTKNKGCKGKIKLDDTGRMISADVSHNHTAPSYIRTRDGISFITLMNGTKALQLDGYTFAKNCESKYLYYCSSKKKGCKGIVKLDEEGRVIIWLQYN